jgi:hypothetical protein
MAGKIVEQRSQWNFQSGDDGWIWTVAHPDGRQESSDQSFKTLKQCVDDATQRGYVAWKAEAERRRELILGVTKTLTRNTNDQ